MMPSWTSPTDIKQQLTRLWERGELLRPLLQAEFTPLKLKLKKPSNAQLNNQFAEVRQWLQRLCELKVVRIEWCSVNHRLHGAQQLPAALWLDNLEPAWQWLGKLGLVRQFRQQIVQTQEHLPALLPWLEKRPLQAVELAAVWELLLAVVQWFVEHPRPGVYLRQIDLPGVHSKFIEQHRTVLAELLDLALPVEFIDMAHSNVAGFAARYGCLDKPGRIRFRALDKSLCPLNCGADITLDNDSFAGLKSSAARVFITENEINYLTFPEQANSLLIFGSGYGWETLAQAQWLQHCELHYWGDLDSHGFAILDSLRVYFPKVQSLLMDNATLMAHQSFWDQEPTPVNHLLPRLTTAEQKVVELLAQSQAVRLEQERIGFGWLQHYLRRLSST